MAVNTAKVEKLVWEYFKKKGLNTRAIAGLMGNIKAESGFRTNNLQDSFNYLGSDAAYTKKVDNGTYKNFVHDGAGYGLCQWTYHTRKQGLLNLAKKKKVSIADPDTQVEYLHQELKSIFKDSVWTKLKKTKSVREATIIVMKNFENPKDQSEIQINKRYHYAMTLYNKYTKEDEAAKTKKVKEKQSTKK